MTTPTGKHASVAGKEAGLSASDSEADVQPTRAPLTEIHQRESKKMTSPTGKDASVAGKEEGSPPPLTLTASTSAEHEVQTMQTSTRAPRAPLTEDGSARQTATRSSMEQLESNEPAKKRFKITRIGTGQPVITAYTGVSSDQLLKTVDGSHQPSLNNSGLCNIPGNTTISGLSQLNMLSLTNLEESIDKELKEAQERKHLCETEERNALKVYMEAQRSLIEANARCSELHSKRASLSAHYGSLIQEGTRLLWPSVHPAGEVSAPAEKEKDEVSASGSKKKKTKSLLLVTNPPRKPVITEYTGPASTNPSASKELVPFAGNVGSLTKPVNAKPLRMIKKNQADDSEVPRRRIKRFFSAEESKRILESVETLLANDAEFLHSKRRNWKLIRDHCFKEDDNQRTSGDVKDKWETLVKAATAGGTKQRGEKLSEPLLQRILAAETRWKSGQEQEEKEDEEEEDDEKLGGIEYSFLHS